MSLKVSSTAPSNIALIKYMGKTSHTENKPSNASLSWSLNHLTSMVEIERSSEENDQWQPLKHEGYFAPILSEKGQARFLDHFALLKKEWAIEGNYVVRSANNFPADCGVASSASSFAALTKASWELARSLGTDKDLTLEDLSRFSRLGSGSSCRSLFPAWSKWEGDGAFEVEYPIKQLEHTLLLLDEEKKMVSSSEAHRRVTTSPLFKGRVERAQKRLEILEQTLKAEDWTSIYKVCLEEFEDMHQLFETSDPPFSYRNIDSTSVVVQIKEFWQSNNDGPVITMDAGANIHLLWRTDQKQLARKYLSDFYIQWPHVKVLKSPGLLEG